MNSHSDSSPAAESLGAPHSVDPECSALEWDDGAIARVRQRRSNDDLVLRTAAIFSAFGDPTRLRILEALSSEELCVCDLADVCEISQSGVSHQLRLLRDLGLVAYTRDRNRAVYRLADHHVKTLLAQGLEHAEESVGAE